MSRRPRPAMLERMENSAPVQTQGRRWRRRLVLGIAALAAVFVAIQLVPYGRSHGNPPTTGEPAWDSARTRTLFVHACGDCHSNLTKWPLYSNIAPISWMVQNDVDSGRAAFDISNWDQPQHLDANDVREAIQGGSMPPWFYTPLHSASRLSRADKQALIAGLERTLAASPALGGGG